MATSQALIVRTFSVNDKQNPSTVKPTLDSVNKIIPDKHNNQDSIGGHIPVDTTEIQPTQ